MLLCCSGTRPGVLTACPLHLPPDGGLLAGTPCSFHPDPLVSWTWCAAGVASMPPTGPAACDVAIAVLPGGVVPHPGSPKRACVCLTPSVATLLSHLRPSALARRSWPSPPPAPRRSERGSAEGEAASRRVSPAPRTSVGSLDIRQASLPGVPSRDTTCPTPVARSVLGGVGHTSLLSPCARGAARPLTTIGAVPGLSPSRCPPMRCRASSHPARPEPVRRCRPGASSASGPATRCRVVQVQLPAFTSKARRCARG